MANITISEQLERRNKIREAWLKGTRTLAGLAKIANCNYKTVKSDLRFFRLLAFQVKKNQDLELKKIEIDAQLVEEIKRCNELIAQASKQMESSESEFDLPDIEPSEVINSQNIKSNQIITRSITKKIHLPNFNAIVGFQKNLLEAISKRMELWGLVQKGGFNLSVKAEANAEAKSNVFSSISESDIRKIIALADRLNSILANGQNSKDSPGGKNRISSSQLE